MVTAPNAWPDGDSSSTGLILDQMEMKDGFFMYEVLVNNEIGWFDEMELKKVDNGK